MANDYEKKLAIKRAKADVRKAINDWHKYSTIGIDQILKALGYTNNPYKMYQYSKKTRTGMESFTIHLDTSELLVGGANTIKYEIEE